MKMEKFAPFFIQDSHNRICESWLSGQRHGRDVSDSDGLRDLQAADRGYMVSTVLAGNPRAANYIDK
jgi:hypothetical protein